MFLAAIASVALAAGQTPSADPLPPDEYEEPAEESAEPSLEAMDEAIEESAESGEEAASGGVAGLDEEEEARICRRQSYYDDFGRQRSRKSCRPRD